jgi:hypothetical protein
VLLEERQHSVVQKIGRGDRRLAVIELEGEGPLIDAPNPCRKCCVVSTAITRCRRVRSPIQLRSSDRTLNYSLFLSECYVNESGGFPNRPRKKSLTAHILATAAFLSNLPKTTSLIVFTTIRTARIKLALLPP